MPVNVNNNERAVAHDQTGELKRSGASLSQGTSAREDSEIQNLHSPVTKAVVGARDLGKDALKAGTVSLHRSAVGIKDKIKQWLNQDGTGSKGIQTLILGIFTLCAAVFSLKKGVDLVRSIFSSSYRKGHTPTAMTALTFFVSTLLTGGAYRHLTQKDKFLDFKKLGIGTLILGFIHALNRAYESPGSIPGKLASLMGVDGMTKDMMNMVSVSKDNYGSGLVKTTNIG